MSDDSNHGRELMKLMRVATSLSFGVLGAIMVSMKGFFGGNASFEFSFKTVVAFVVGALAGWIFWRVIARLPRKG